MVLLTCWLQLAVAVSTYSEESLHPEKSTCVRAELQCFYTVCGNESHDFSLLTFSLFLFSLKRAQLQFKARARWEHYHFTSGYLFSSQVASNILLRVETKYYFNYPKKQFTNDTSNFQWVLQYHFKPNRFFFFYSSTSTFPQRDWIICNLIHSTVTGETRCSGRQRRWCSWLRDMN